MQNPGCDVVEIFLVRVSIGIRYATDNLDVAHALVVRLHRQGINGWGEVFCPKPEPMWNWAARVAPLMIGCDPARLDAALDTWPSERPKLSPEDCGTYFHPDVDPIAEAFSIALHDLAAREQGVTFRSLFGKPEREIIPGMPVVGIDTAESMAASAKAWSNAGLRYIKIKLAGRAEEDIERVAKVRETLAPGVEIQVDANGSYPDDSSAAPLINALNTHKVEVIEDLFDVGNIELCKFARNALSGRYMVDKDAHWPRVLDILKTNAADIINQHPHNQGRMSHAMLIAKAARDAGVETAIGSSGIFGIQSAAFQQLASVIGLTRPCEDISMLPYFEGPVRDRFHFDAPPTVLKTPLRLHNGMLHLPKGPGLGIEINHEALEKLTVQRKAFKA